MNCPICNDFGKIHPVVSGKPDYSKVVYCQCQSKAGVEIVTSATGQYPQSTDEEISNYLPMPDTRGTAADWYRAAGITPELLNDRNNPSTSNDMVMIPTRVIDDYRKTIADCKLELLRIRNNNNKPVQTVQRQPAMAQSNRGGISLS